ncbi:MAG: ABC transporter permease [Candidatus Eiseniibacteriota bacterium]|jgi:lipoprotein-releasing system permease protein
MDRSARRRAASRGRNGGRGYELFIAQRYLWSRPRSSFISLISIIAVLGVIVGVLVLTITLSGMNGFEAEVRSKIVGANAHIVLLTHDTAGLRDYEALVARLEEDPDIVGTSPILYTKAMLSLDQRADGVVVKGVDLAREADVTEVPDYIVPPIDGDIDDAGFTDLPGIVLGFDVAMRLVASIGDTVAMTSPIRTVRTPLGAVPIVKQFEVVGLFHCGMYEYDSSFCFVSIPAAQRFMNMEGRATGIEIRIRDMFAASEKAETIEAAFGPPYVANNWMDVNRNLFAWMQIEKFFMFLILLLIILVAAFNIASMLIMVVMEKKRDVGVLRAMGATRRSVMQIFILQGLQVAVVGTVIGSLLGLAASWAIDRYKIISLPPDVYFIDTLPIRIEALDFLAVGVATILICFLAALYPAWRAARLVPVEAIRYE